MSVSFFKSLNGAFKDGVFWLKRNNGIEPAKKTGKPCNALTLLENEIINQMLASRDLADASCRVLNISDSNC